MNWEQLRQGQRQALRLILSRIPNHRTTSVILPTRYGKSDVIRLASILSVKEGVSSGSIVLSPTMYLRNQLVSKAKLLAMCSTYDLETSLLMKMRTTDSFLENRPFPNGEFMLSATIQLATKNINDLHEMVDSVVYTTGKPVLVHIDECHEVSEQKRRGELVASLLTAGACVIMYTATAIRADGELIPGFTFKEISSDEFTKYICHDVPDEPTKILVEKWFGKKTWVQLVADYENTSFHDAWDEDPPVLCKLSREVVDVVLGDDESRLSACSDTEAKRQLQSSCRSPFMIDQAVDRFLNELSKLKKVNRHVAGLIFTGNDKDRIEDNAHAADVASSIKQQQANYGLKLKLRTVTMKTLDGDRDAADMIADFVGTKESGEDGDGDVLLVKQMAGSGVDVGRVKVILDLSPVRTVASCIQRWTRAATPWMGFTFCSIIMPADPMADLIWEQFVLKEGGEYKKLPGGIEDLSLIESYLKDRSKKPGPEVMGVTSAEVTAYDDSEGTVGDMDMYALADQFLDMFPEISKEVSKAQAAERLKSNPAFHSIVCKGRTTMQPLDPAIEKLRSDIHKRLKHHANGVCKYDPASGDKQPWIEAYARKCNDAKSHAGVSTDIKLESIKEIPVLAAMLDYLA